MARISKKHRKEAELYLTEQDFLDSIERASDIPSKQWLFDNFKSKSAMIRYLRLEKKLDVKQIVGATGLPYRHVYSVVHKADKTTTPTHICPVCKNRKG